MKKKIYYRIQFKNVEPLSIGSGENVISDKDVLKTSQGKPFIPGSSLCGVYREILHNNFGLSEKQISNYFGYITITESQKKESQIIVYDAMVQSNNCRFAVRDSVGLDEYKVAKKGAKFDFEYLEPGAIFNTYIEQNILDENDDDIGALLANEIVSNGMYLGYKTMRGCGRIECCAVQRCEFDLDKDLHSWLDFDMYNADSEGWKSFDANNVYQKEHSNKVVDIELKLKQKGGISIRQYTTELSKDNNNQPDYVHMNYKNEENEERVPYIPGSSWAGAFRHQIESYVGEKSEIRDVIFHELFGMSDEKKNQSMKKSNVRFSESVLVGGKWKTVTRNAIDRFTNATIDGALYTEQFYYDGNTSLHISYKNCETCKNIKWERYLAACITDLQYGFLSVGGLTSVGRGLFTIESCSINGKIIWDKNNQNEALFSTIIKTMNTENEGGTQAC